MSRNFWFGIYMDLVIERDRVQVQAAREGGTAAEFRRYLRLNSLIRRAHRYSR